MNKIDKAFAEFREMDALADGDTGLHRLHPAVKLITTIGYIAVTVSFGKYNIAGLILMSLIPLFLYSYSGVSMWMCMRKLAPVLPLVLAVGLFNPLFDRAPVMKLGEIVITGGMLSMVTLMLKGILSLLMSFLLIATTRFDAICAVLRHAHVPSILVTLLLLTYRYISVMMEEVAVMTDAYHLRAPRQKGIHISAWGSFLGQLLLRSMDRATDLYAAMCLRGFDGNFTYTDIRKSRMTDIIYLLGFAFIVVSFRWGNIAEWIGRLVV